MKQTESHKPPVSRFALFLTFSRISLSAFGGALFWARRGLVERQRWLTEREFVELLTLGQLLPGPNVLNLTVMVGYRFAGWPGAAAAAAGFLGWPCLVVIGMGVLYQHYGALPLVQRALAGMSSVAAVSTSVRCFCIFWPSGSSPSAVPRRYCRTSTATWWRCITG
jgi:chromate transporter